MASLGALQRVSAAFIKDEAGATAIEYGVLAGIVGVGMIGVAEVLRSRLSAAFANLANTLGTVQGLS